MKITPDTSVTSKYESLLIYLKNNLRTKLNGKQENESILYKYYDKEAKTEIEIDLQKQIDLDIKSIDMIMHFGIKVKPGKYGLKLNRDTYALINKKNSFRPNAIPYTDEWCLKQREDSLINYDLNMEFFSIIDHNKFNYEIDSFINKNPMFVEIEDLTEYNNSGYYVMILDQYKQVYIGTATNISKRIKQHWAGTKQFDRLIFGGVEKS